MSKLPKTIVIIGIGLIGASIAMSLKSRLGREIKIIGVSKNLENSQRLQKLGLIDQSIENLSLIPDTTELIIISTPINVITKIISELVSRNKASTSIMDVGSIKGEILSYAEKFGKKINFLGTHPMAGSEKQGHENADPNLFMNKPWVICKSNNTNKKTLDLVENVIKIMGAKPIFMNVIDHDQTITWASHMSLILTSILTCTAAKKSYWEKIEKAASTGFRDTTRLASQNPKMKKDIVAFNKTNIIQALNDLQKEITLFQNLLEKGNDSEILGYFSLSKKLRDDWIKKYFMA